jgi:exopolyphosphatase / guanosine-5'-triphosphate,3'-diphosphate pyrophosphatase
MHDGTLLAAVDLGSNSYRLEIGQLLHGQIQRVDYLKETVRQGSGLDKDRNLTPEAMERGLLCLARFAERLAGFNASQVRAVATQTLREARNRDEFLNQAQTVLGFPIDVISGREEARLIYQGVSHLLPQSPERRLVVDIGGRSTELIQGQGLEARLTESYRLGCVAWSLKYFAEGAPTARLFQIAEVAAKALLDDATESFRAMGWDTAYGSSGTIGAVGEVLQANGVAGVGGTITAAGLRWLKEKLINGQNVNKVQIDGLKDERRPVICGGLSILLAVFDLLQIEALHPARGALRHGVLYELLDREDNAIDLRARTVQRLAVQFQVDTVQADRVCGVASHIFNAVATKEQNTERYARKLRWAATLHELGRQISHSDYHKHGAYILDNADAMGFSQPELHRLSLLVLGHKGKLRKLDAALNDEVFALQLLSLRLAVILCHARRQPELDGLNLHRQYAHVYLSANPAWVNDYPQSVYLLAQEVAAWGKLQSPIGLSWRNELESIF